MFKTCCGECGECWYVGNPRTCTCPDETTQRTWVGLTKEEIAEFDTWHDTREEEVGWCNPSEIVAYIEAKLKEKNMKSEQIKHSLSVGTKSIQSRVFCRETDEVISFVKIPIADSGLVRCEKGTKQMNNEPVAYVNSMCNDYIDWKADPMSIDGQPLYTHPAELTDEEIIKVYEDMLGVASAKGSAIDFARAILRKASEK